MKQLKIKICDKEVKQNLLKIISILINFYKGILIKFIYHIYHFKDKMNTLKCIQIIKIVFMSLAQLVWTMHNICKVWGSSSDYHKKIIKINILIQTKL